MVSSKGDAPPISPNAPAVGGGDLQQEVIPSGSRGSPGNATPMNPLLLASVCHGSSAALKFLFDMEDKEERPMMMPTEIFLDKLAGSSTGRTLTVAQASDDLEAGIDQPAALPVAAPDTPEVDVDQPAALPAAAPDTAEAGADQSAARGESGADQPAAAAAPDTAEAGAALQAAAPDTAEAGADQSAALPAAPDTAEAGAALPVAAPDTAEARAALQAAAPGTAEAGVDQPALSVAAPVVVEDAVVLLALPAAATGLLKGVTAEGDTALHVVATNGESTGFLECASIIDKRDQDLLFAVNKYGDTPLHCAARAGKSKIVSRLIELAASRNRMHELLRKENVRKETALHEAICIGDKDIVKLLLKADPLLANYPERGSSPLYLAIATARKKNKIAKLLHEKSNGNLSYKGPHEKNALHAAMLRGKGVEDILNWNKSLITHGDTDGSTPLHMASSRKRSPLFELLLKANPAAVYQADNKGLFPIHVMASLGAEEIVKNILEKYPSSAGLRTAQGQTFLHVAVVKRRLNIVSYVCQTVSLSWILNIRDNQGNTAIHLAVKSAKFRMFCSLYGNKEVLLSITNNRGETPYNLSKRLIPRGMYYEWNDSATIYDALGAYRTYYTGLRMDLPQSKHIRKFDQAREEDKVKDSSQILGISSVLIASVAFNATFAVPGGFIADDHKNRGTPTLAGSYAFDAFVMANTLAFICSLIATIGLTHSGSSLYNLKLRRASLSRSVFFISSSVTSLSAAFALGVYMVLALVARPTAIAVCVLSPFIVLYRNMEVMRKLFFLTRPIYRRCRPIRATKWLLWVITKELRTELWPFIIIFGWAAIAHKFRNH